MKFATAAVTLCLVAALAYSAPVDIGSADDILAAVGITPNMNSADIRARTTELANGVNSVLEDLFDSIAEFDAAELAETLLEAKDYFDTILKELEGASKNDIYTGITAAFEDAKPWLFEVLAQIGFDVTGDAKKDLSANIDQEFEKALEDFMQETANLSDEELRQRVRADIKNIENAIDMAQTYMETMDLTTFAGFVAGIQQTIGDMVANIPDYTYQQYRDGIESAFDFFQNMPFYLGQ